MDEIYFPFVSRAKFQKNVKILQVINDSRQTSIIDSRCIPAPFQTKEQTQNIFGYKSKLSGAED